MGTQILKRAGGAMLATVGVLVVCGLILGQVQGGAQSYLYGALGWTGIVITGLVGTPVHELGHYLFCKLFAFQVGEVALFRPIAGQRDGILGYVQYSYNTGSLWQRLGCFFVGIAPMLVGALVIVLVLRILTPEVFKNTSRRLSDAMGANGSLALLLPRMVGAALLGIFGGLVKLRGIGLLRGVACLYIVLSVSTHMTLSFADLQGALPGFVVVVGLCLLFGLVTTLFRVEVKQALLRTAAFLGAYLSIGIFFALISLIFSGVFYSILR